MKKLLTVLSSLLLFTPLVSAASVFQVVQGGTGATTLTGCLTGNGTSAITGTGSPCGGSGSTPGGSDTYVQFNDASSFGGSSLLTFSKGTGLLSGLSAFFTFTTTTNFLATGSSTLQNFTGLKSTTTNATTTSLAISSILSKLLKTDGNGSVIPAVAGSDYQAAITPAALTKTDDTNVTLTLGGSPSTALLAATSLTLGWTGTLADSRVADNLTISGGTVDNSVIGGTTPAAGTFTNLLATGSSTLQNFTALNSTSTNATTTTFFSPLASTTSLYLATGTCSGSNALNVIGGKVTCGTVSGSGAASTTLLIDNNHFTGNNVIDFLVGTRATITDATTTTLSTGIASTTSLYINQASGCLQVNAAGKVVSTGVNCSTGGSGDPYPFQGTGNSTSTLVQFLQGLTSYSSSTISALTVTNGTTTNATSTTFSTSKASTTSLWISGTKSAILLTDISGAVSGYGGASACASNNFVTTISALGATTCGSSTISGIALGSNLASLSHGATLTGTSYNGSAAVSNWDIDLTVGNVWTAASSTFSGGVTMTKSTTTNATTTGAASIGFASTTNLRIDTAKSALLLTNGTGDVSAYGGASACAANNFVTALSVLGATTCGSSTISGVALGGTLAALTAGTTLTSGGTYTGATTRTFDIDLTHANTWTGGQTFNNATATTYALTGTSNPPVVGIYSAAANQIDFSTASIWRGGFTAAGLFDIGTTTPTWTFTVASTAPYMELDDTDGATNQKHLVQWWNDGTFGIATSSDSTLTATSTAFFKIDTKQPFSALFGTSTPTTGIQFDLFNKNATSSQRIDTDSVTKGACLVMKDMDGVGYTYVTANNGVLTASQTSCL